MIQISEDIASSTSLVCQKRPASSKRDTCVNLSNLQESQLHFHLIPHTLFILLNTNSKDLQQTFMVTMRIFIVIYFYHKKPVRVFTQTLDLNGTKGDNNNSYYVIQIIKPHASVYPVTQQLLNSLCSPSILFISSSCC